MKKIIFTIIMITLVIINVEGKTNKLEFTEGEERLYYDTDAFEEEIFMSYDDMIPGKVYTEELIIENKTKTTYKLYLKVVEVEQEELAEELIDNIEMDIYLDNELIYSGYARGLDYKKEGVNLQEAILIGEYKPGKESELVVKTKLSESYTNTNNTSIGEIDWEFYGSYISGAGEEVKPIIPETSDSIAKYIVILSSSAIVLLTILMIVYKKKEKNA